MRELEWKAKRMKANRPKDEQIIMYIYVRVKHPENGNSSDSAAG